jgi:hypothetical protein
MEKLIAAYLQHISRDHAVVNVTSVEKYNRDDENCYFATVGDDRITVHVSDLLVFLYERSL